MSEKSEIDSRFIEKDPILYRNNLLKAAYRKEDIIREDIIEGDEILFMKNEKAIYDK